MTETIRVAASTAPKTSDAIAELVAQITTLNPVVVFVFYGTSHQGGEVSSAFARALPGALMVGCTTMGEISPKGSTEASMSVLAMGRPCRAAAERIPDVDGFRFADGGPLMSRLAAGLGLSCDELDPKRHVVLTLTDGLSTNQEQLFASLGEAVPELALVGGSAGDDFEMLATHCFVGTDAGSGGGAVILLERVGFPSIIIVANEHRRSAFKRMTTCQTTPLVVLREGS